MLNACDQSALATAELYEKQAERARRFAEATLDAALADQLRQLARDFAEMAEDVQNGRMPLRHPELLFAKAPRSAAAPALGLAATPAISARARR
jgi:hypothetical protein